MKSLLISSGGILRPKNGPILSISIINLVAWLGPTPAQTNPPCRGAALRGLRYILYQPLAQALRPGLVIVIVGSIYWFVWPGLGPELALSAQLVGTAFLALFTCLLLQHLSPNKAKNVTHSYETSRSASPFRPV